MRSDFLLATLLAIAACHSNAMEVDGDIDAYYMIPNAISTVYKPLTAKLSNPISFKFSDGDKTLIFSSYVFCRFGDPLCTPLPSHTNFTAKMVTLEIGPTVISSIGYYRFDAVVNTTDDTPDQIWAPIDVNSRPFFHHNGSINMVLDDNNPFLVRRADKVRATLGMPLTVQCPAVGHPKPVITWYKDKLLLKASENVQFNGKELYIVKFTEDDAGRYRCRVANLFYPFHNALEAVLVQIVDWK